MPLSRLLYYSENQLNPKNGSTLQQLSELMKVSRRNNEMRSITGALVFNPLWFFQCLEGERTTIMSVFDLLKDDERHSNVSLVALEDITERSFGSLVDGPHPQRRAHRARLCAIPAAGPVATG